MDSKAVWPGWETVRLIGRGSFGAVYEIERDILGEKEKAALKVITIPQSNSDINEMFSDGYDEESITSTFKEHLKSIIAEYSLMRKLNGSSNVVNCDDVRYVQHDDGFGWDIFIKMELLTPLTAALPAEVSESQAVKIAKDLCRALVQCKQFGIIHRDIKPQNIFVSPLGDYKLGDFGIAKTVEKTSGGTKIGTYKYMAPEVYNNQPYGAGADIYSLGLVLYWLLNERRMPFLPLPPEKLRAGLEEDARMRRFRGDPLPAPAHGSVELKQIVLKACAYDPKDRYHSAEEMLQDLELLGGTPQIAHFRANFGLSLTEPEAIGEGTIGAFRAAAPDVQDSSGKNTDEYGTKGVFHAAHSVEKQSTQVPVIDGSIDASKSQPPCSETTMSEVDGTIGAFKTQTHHSTTNVHEADGTIGAFKTKEPHSTTTISEVDGTIGVLKKPQPKTPPVQAAIGAVRQASDVVNGEQPTKVNPVAFNEQPAPQRKKKTGLIIGILGGVLALAAILLIVFLPKSSTNSSEGISTVAATQTPVVKEEYIFDKSDGVMSFEEYMAAEEGTQVTVEAFVQGHQDWWDNKVTVYAQDEDGGYFFYDMACSEADAVKLIPGTKIKVTGIKAVWSGQVEITDATFEFEEGSYVAPAININKLLGTGELVKHMNEFVSVSGGVIADKGGGAAFFYSWDNSGEDGNCDLYFDVEIEGAVYTFVVRRYLTAPGSEVYEAVKNLKVGDTVDIEGFLYWYEGPQPHITSIKMNSSRNDEVSVNIIYDGDTSVWRDDVVAVFDKPALGVFPSFDVNVAVDKYSMWAGTIFFGSRDNADMASSPSSLYTLELQGNLEAGDYEIRHRKVDNASKEEVCAASFVLHVSDSDCSVSGVDFSGKAGVYSLYSVVPEMVGTKILLHFSFEDNTYFDYSNYPSLTTDIIFCEEHLLFTYNQNEESYWFWFYDPVPENGFVAEFKEYTVESIEFSKLTVLLR